jgi:glutathione synthase/RimK-type ligase-like ATP-grasp enzyme
MSQKIVLLRRRKLGNTSCNAIKSFSTNEIEVVRNDKSIPSNIDLLIRWGCISKVDSKHTLNKSEAIHAVNHKVNSRIKMQENGISVPKIFINKKIEFPVVVRPAKHSQGRNLWLCNNANELYRVLKKPILSRLGWYISKYIAKEQEFGVFIFNNRVTSVIEKKPKNANAINSVAWNVAQGTHEFVNVNWDNWPMQVCIESLKAIKLFNLDFGRVDVIVKDRTPYILEINSAHSLTSPYRQELFAKCVDYYLTNGFVKNEIDFDKVKTYKSIIHPALRVNNNQLNL